LAARFATGGATAAASRALGACERTLTLVADSRKELCDLFAVAGGTSDFFLSKNQDLKILVAFRTVIFKDGHVLVSLPKR
jgi:hypothetical protein